MKDNHKFRFNSLKKWGSKLIPLLLLVVILFISFSLAQKSIPFKITDLLPEDSVTRKNYEEFQARMNEENKGLILVKKAKGRFSSSEVVYISQLLNKNLGRKKYIKSITTPYEAEYLQYYPGEFQLTPFFFKDQPLSENARKSLDHDLFKKRFIDEKHESFIIRFEFLKIVENEFEKSASVDIFRGLEILKEYLKSENIEVEFYPLGTKVVKKYFLDEMLRNQNFITPLLMLCLCVIFYFLFRSVTVLIISGLTLLFSYLLVIMSILFVDKGFNPYNGLALIFTLIVGTSDLIHYFSALTQLQSKFSKRRDLIIEVRKKIIIPCFYTSLTTAIGFASLYFNGMRPIVHFGLYCSLGSFFAFVLTFTLIPFLLEIFNYTPKQRTMPTFDISHIAAPLLEKKKTIIAIFMTTLFVLSISLRDLKISDDFYQKFVDKHPLSKTIKEFDKRYDYIGTIDLELESIGQKKLSAIEIAEKFEKTHEEIIKIPEVKKVDSLSLIKNYVDEIMNITPSSGESLLEDRNLFLDFLSRQKILGVHTDSETTKHYAKVYLSDFSSDKILQTIEKIKQISTNNLNITIQGFATIRSHLVNMLIENFIYSFAFSFILIFITFYFMNRSFSLAVLAMIPNIYPLIFILGMFKLFKINIESNLVILVCISIGVAVDDTVHFLYAFRKYIHKYELLEALKKSFHDTSKALIGTTLVFFVCIPCFFLAELKLMMQMAFFILGALSVALICDFILLPAIMGKYNLFYKLK